MHMNKFNRSSSTVLNFEGLRIDIYLVKVVGNIAPYNLFVINLV